MSLRVWWRGLGAPPRFLVLGAFLFAGEMKAGPVLAHVPVDLTLAAGGVLALLLLRHWLGGARAGSARGLLLTAGWFLTFLPGALAAADSTYAFQKVATIFTFSLAAALAPFVLVQGRDDLRGLLNAMALFCLFMTLDSLLGAEAGAQRLQTAGGGTIALGRAAGFLFLVGAVRLAEAGPGALPTLAVTAAAAVAALFSGSRGPLGGATLALVLTFAAARGDLGAARLRLALRGGAVLLVLVLSLALAPQGSLRRTQAFLRGEFGASEQYRAAAARASWDRLRGAPWGMGWGGFAAQVDLESGATRQYPHNLLLETTLESGWLCGAATLLTLGAGLGAAWSLTTVMEGRILFAGLVFSIVNALVSGDLNDNRPLFTLLSSALCFWGRERAA